MFTINVVYSMLFVVVPGSQPGFKYRILYKHRSLIPEGTIEYAEGKGGRGEVIYSFISNSSSIVGH